MGVGNLMEDLFHGSKQVPQIGRAYFHQSVALVSICRQIVPHVGLYQERNDELKGAIESLNKALEHARKAGRQENTEAQDALNAATRDIAKYLRTYHLTPADKVMGDINKLLITSETAPDTEPKVDQVAVAEERLDEMRKKDQHAGQQIQHLSQRLKFKLRSLSARKIKLEVWVWPAELNLNESGVRRPEVVLEEDALLDHVLCRVLDFVPIDKLALSLTLNPQFYETNLTHLRDKPLPSPIEPLEPSTTLLNCPSVLHLVVDRQWRVVLDVANQVQVFGNLIKVRDDVILKNKLGALVSATKLLSKEKLSFYSYPLEVTMQAVEWSSVVNKAAEMDESCDFLLSQRSPNQSAFKDLKWKPINRSPDTKVPPKRQGHPGGKLQNVAQGVDFIGSDMAPISQTFRQEPAAPPPKKWYSGFFGRR